MKKIVLTGAPASGKTKILGVFRQMGIPVIGEVASAILAGGLYSPPAPWTPEWQKGLQVLIAKMQVAAEKASEQLYQNRVILLDRGLYDGAAYLIRGGYSPEKAIKMVISWSELIYYDIAILLKTTAHDPELYAKLKASNPARFEEPREALEIERNLRLAYTLANQKGLVGEFIALDTLDLQEAIRVIEGLIK